ncbi:MAG: glycosyltransferase family 39 protein [Jatrophihabitantaceae bacterium]
MTCTTVLYPAFQNPDEAAHVDYVLAHRHGEWFDGTGERQYQSGVKAAVSLVPSIQFGTHVGKATPVPRSQRPSFDALGTEPAQSPIPNQMTQHPPLYYGLAAVFSYLLPHFADRRFDVQVAWLRLLSVLLLLPVPLLIFSASRWATGSRWVGLTAAALPLSIPSYLRTGAAVNNDSLMLLSSAVLAALLVRVAFGDLRRSIAVLVGLAWAAALLSKGFALVMPPAIALAYLAGTSGRLRQRLAMSWRPVLLAGAIGTALGGWWWVRNLVVYGAVQPDGLEDLSDAVRQQVFGRDRDGATELNFLVNFLRLLGARAWGSIGLIDEPSLAHWLLYPIAFAAVLATLAGVVAGSRRVRGRSAWLQGIGWRLDRSVSLLLPALLTAAVMYLGARPRYLRGHQLAGDQARYLLPAMLGLLICMSVALCLVAGRRARWVPPASLTAALVFAAMSAYRLLDVDMSDASPSRRDRMSSALHYVIGWAPVPGLLTVLVLILTGLTALAAVLASWLGAARDGAGQPGVAAPDTSFPADVARLRLS